MPDATLGAPALVAVEHLGWLVDQLPVVLWSTDGGLRITSIRGGALAAAGFAPTELEGRAISDAISHPEMARIALTAHRSALRGESVAYEITVGGRAYSARVAPLTAANGAVVGVVGSAFDVTEHRRAEEELRASRTALRRLAARQQAVREQERTRIAREIHDTLGQSLTALKLELAAARKAAEGGLADQLRETARLVDDLIKSIRRIATELRPPILDALGLPAAVEWLARDVGQRTGIDCRAVIELPDAGLDQEVATGLFRILQEALANVARHAAARRVDIALRVASAVVTLDVVDDGRGITEAEATGPRSLGILGMRERATALGGVLEVGPATGGGTRVVAWFPLAHT